MAKMKQFSQKFSLFEISMETIGKDESGHDGHVPPRKINPLGGCWPILIQIPVFIALYWVLLESVELRQADLFFGLTIFRLEIHTCSPTVDGHINVLSTKT